MACGVRKNRKGVLAIGKNNKEKIELDAKTGQLAKLDVQELTRGIIDEWKNFVVSRVNDHVVRLSVLQRDFHWHSHPESDGSTERTLILCFESEDNDVKGSE